MADPPPTTPALPGGGGLLPPAPPAGRAWHDPGLLRRIEARGGPVPRRARRRSWWPAGPPSQRWTAEGTAMVLLGALCLSLVGVATAGLTSGGSPSGAHTTSGVAACAARCPR